MIKTKPTLLAVDDVAINIDILLEALGNAYNVRVATSGATALESVKNDPPDLILLDVMMPGMDGFEVCRHLKDDPATQNIPIIFLTALNQDYDESRGLEMGAVDYISKPFKAAIINARVRNHLELKAHRDHLAELVAERTRELAKAYERLLELDRLKDDFMGMISHEIRTPANGILGVGELLIGLCPASEDCTLYSDLFQESGLRLRNLIDDATMIAQIEKTPLPNGAEISFPRLIDNVRPVLADIRISMDEQDCLEHVFLQGDLTLLNVALKTMILLAAAFSRDKHAVHIVVVDEERALRVRVAVDALLLSENQTAGFFAMGSSDRSQSAAESLGLAPVVAQKIIAALGGEMKLVKGEGKTGYLEAILIKGNNGMAR